MWGKTKNTLTIVQVTFNAINEELVRFKTHLSSIDCPACKQKTLVLGKYEQGPEGCKDDKGKDLPIWLAQISCGNCNFAGSMSSMGFSFIEVSSKGKAVDKTK